MNAAKRSKNKVEGRLCGGTSGCSNRATQLVVNLSWTYQVGQGAPSRTVIPMCGSHASEHSRWYDSCGVNFVTTHFIPLNRSQNAEAIAVITADVKAQPITEAEVENAVTRWQASGVTEHADPMLSDAEDDEAERRRLDG